MKLKISVENMNEEAVGTILGNIRTLVEDYSREVGLMRYIKIEEVK